MRMAPDFLRQAATLIETRAADRDLPAERSMRRAVAVFNALTGVKLSEVQGWVFMAVLKLSRAQGGRFCPDDYLDGAAYLALALEALSEPLEALQSSGEGVATGAGKTSPLADPKAPERASLLKAWLAQEALN